MTGNALANPIYTYTGRPFTSASDPTIGTSVTASVTFDNTVGPDFTGVVSSADIVSWEISSGPTTLTSSSAGPNPTRDQSFVFSNGTITNWDLEGITPTNYIFTLNEPTTVGSEDSVLVHPVGFGGLQNFNVNQPGSWSSPTPSCGSIINSKSVILSGQGTTQARISFTPSAAIAGLTLSAAATDCGVAAFDWTQVLTVPTPSPFHECLSEGCLSTINASGTIADPPLFGYSYCNPSARLAAGIFSPQIDCSESNPFFYPLSDAETDPTSYCIQLGDFDNCIAHLATDNTSLNFTDNPADNCLFGGTGKDCEGKTAPNGQSLVFNTELVGITADGSIINEFGAEWDDNYNGSSGGVGATISERPVDPGGTGGISLISLNGVPVAVPEPSSLALFLAGLLQLWVTYLGNYRGNRYLRL
jgi:hypothetical protein